MIILKYLLLFCCFTGIFGQNVDWWIGANFYQIYPRSFMDSNGDGVGDLQGIKSKLRYVKDLGMDGVWLSPIFKSPMADHGYDISDFRDIHSEFGTLKDFDELQVECKRLDLKLILDFVPNHSSDEHEWFKKSERREPGYENYYVWHPGKIDNHTLAIIPPNNWLAAFRYSAWKWSDIRQQLYYHKFLDKQPDLNYRNPKVVQEMKDVLTFWLDRGVAGFRIDAVPTLFEIEPEENGFLPDEPRSFESGCDPDDHCYLKHIYTEDRDEVYDMVYQWREHLENYRKRRGGDTKVMMTESYAPLNLTLKYYGDGNREGSHIPFNFELIVKMNINSTAKDYKETIEAWIKSMPKGHQANWVIGNHDRHRAATRLGVSRGDLINILLQTLPGVAITYQGEELVMEDVYVSWNDTQDPGACHTNPDIFHEVSRDPCRTPFPWDDSKNAGFSNASKTWLPVGDKYKTVNVKTQSETPNSHLKIFKRLLQLRKELVMRLGDYSSVLMNNENVYAYKREYNGLKVYVKLNFAKNSQTVNLTSEFQEAPSEIKVFTSSLDSGFTDGQIINTSSVLLRTNNGIVLYSNAMIYLINRFVFKFVLLLIVLRLFRGNEYFTIIY